MSNDLLRQYKGDKSNYDTVKGELENLLEELSEVNRLKVDDSFAEEALEGIKNLRLLIDTITE